jgi:hypothetical protein
MKNINIKILISLLMLLSVGCQTQKKWQKVGYSKGWLKDSVITKYDTIKGYELDTIVQFDTLHHTDTLFTYQNGLKVTTIVKWRERQVKQIINQKDTILIRKFSTKVIKEKGKWWDTWLIGFVSFLLLLLILALCFKWFLYSLGKNPDINTH